MARTKNFPAWYYGPEGEARIFSEEDDVPKGWKDRPFAEVGPDAPTRADLEKTIEEQAARIEVLEAAIEAQGGLKADSNMDGYTSIPEIRDAYAAGKITVDEIAAAEAKREKPRAGVLALIEEARAAEKPGTSPKEDEIVTRDEAIADLREAGVEIADDATDAEIEAALTELG